MFAVCCEECVAYLLCEGCSRLKMAGQCGVHCCQDTQDTHCDLLSLETFHTAAPSHAATRDDTADTSDDGGDGSDLSLRPVPHMISVSLPGLQHCSEVNTLCALQHLQLRTECNDTTHTTNALLR